MKRHLVWLFSGALCLLNLQPAHSDSLIKGAILEKEWTCISVKSNNAKPLEAVKVATISIDKPKTTINGKYKTLLFNGADISVISGNWQTLLISVKSNSKIYGQKFVSVKINEKTKLNFKSTFPTSLQSNLYFLINLYETSPKSSIGAACSPAARMQNGSFANQDISQQSVNGNPVYAKIQSRIKDLAPPQKQFSPPEIDWIIENSEAEQFKNQLITQHLQLASTYPTLYDWPTKAIGIIGDLTKWIPNSSLITPPCLNFLNELSGRWKALPNLENRSLAGTTQCGPTVMATFRPNPTNPLPPGDLMGQEFGGEIQTNSQRLNPSISQLNRGELNIPDWYLQGGQSALAFVSHVATKRTMEGSYSMAFMTDDCRGVTLESLNRKAVSNTFPSTCVYTKGFATVQLMIALYGWEAPISWFSGFSDSQDFESAFKKVYGDSLSDFNKLADSYWNFIENPRNVPSDLIRRLAL